jgi:beta-glucanase (GH16 family)
LECYTNGSNASVSGGKLVMEARNESYSGCNYTSHRMKSFATFSGNMKVEANIKLPYGQGVFPAFWLLTSDYANAGSYGEIDILELVGYDSKTIWGSTHRPDMNNLPSGTKDGTQNDTLSVNFSDDFHVFGIQKTNTSIEYYVDSKVYWTVPMNADGSDGYAALQSHPMWVILNFAIGGDWAGAPDQTTVWPQDMMVDWVRVYTN